MKIEDANGVVTRIWHSKVDSALQVTLHLLEANAESGKLVPMSVKVGEKAWLTNFFYLSPL